MKHIIAGIGIITLTTIGAMVSKAIDPTMEQWWVLGGAMLLSQVWSAWVYSR